MRILITGGAGFIGSHLCERLIADGHEVICVDNLITGSLANIAPLTSHSTFTFLQHNISQPIEISGSLDYVLHFASPASPPDYLKYPIPTLKVGSLGTHNALGLAKAKRAQFLLASTSEVYGDPQVHPQTESYWGHVNPVGVRGCFSEDTEILTAAGWKHFNQLLEDEEVLTCNADHILEYQKPTEVIRQRYIGELIQFVNTKVDLLVTPNHKMYVRERGKRRFELVEAFEAIRWERAEMLKAGPAWRGEEQPWVHLPLVKNAKTKQHARIPMDLWLEFFGYFITDGSTYLRHRVQWINNKRYETRAFAVLISQSRKNAAHRQKIKDCLIRLGYHFYEENAQFRILSKQLYTYLSQFGRAKDKYVPQEFLLLSTRQLRILFNAMMLGDGSWDMRKFYSSSLHLLGAMQELLLKLGMAGNVRSRDKKRGTYALYIVSDKKKDFLTPQYPRRTVEHYDGYVYCVTVPNHVLYVRRNGKAVWCGNCYDEAKRFAEALTMAYHREHGIGTHIIRIFNTYGPRMRMEDGRAIPAFITQALRRESLTVFGQGTQTRSFCYVDDLVEGIIRLMGTSFAQPMNLGNPEEYTILELAKRILEVTHSPSQIVYRDLPQDDPKQRCPDISLAKRELRWQAKMPLLDGLRRTVDWFAQEMKLAPATGGRRD